jgi:hypothetical protein
MDFWRGVYRGEARDLFFSDFFLFEWNPFVYYKLQTNANRATTQSEFILNIFFENIYVCIYIFILMAKRLNFIINYGWI